MQRIPFPDLETLQPHVRQSVERFKLNIVSMSANGSPQVFDGFAKMGGAVAANCAFDAKVREAVILRVGYLSRSEYELHHHLSIARSLGMNDNTLKAIETQNYASLEPNMAAAARFADEVVTKGNCSDATLAEVRKHYGARGVIDLIFLIGLYMAVARVIAVSGIELDEAALKSLGS